MKAKYERKVSEMQKKISMAAAEVERLKANKKITKKGRVQSLVRHATSELHGKEKVDCEKIKERVFAEKKATAIQRTQQPVPD